MTRAPDDGFELARSGDEPFGSQSVWGVLKDCRPARRHRPSPGPWSSHLK